MSGKKWRNQRQKRLQGGRKVDIRVDDDGRVRDRPGGAKRAPTPLLFETQDPYAVHLDGQTIGYLERGVSAAVVDDGDNGVEWELIVEE